MREFAVESTTQSLIEKSFVGSFKSARTSLNWSGVWRLVLAAAARPMSDCIAQSISWATIGRTYQRSDSPEHSNDPKAGRQLAKSEAMKFIEEVMNFGVNFVTSCQDLAQVAPVHAEQPLDIKVLTAFASAAYLRTVGRSLATPQRTPRLPWNRPRFEARVPREKVIRLAGGAIGIRSRDGFERCRRNSAHLATFVLG